MIVHVRFIDLPLRPNFASPIRIHAVTGGLSEVLAAGLTSRCVYSLPVYARTCRIVLSGEAGSFQAGGSSATRRLTRSKAELTLLIPGLVLGASGRWHVIR